MVMNTVFTVILLLKFPSDTDLGGGGCYSGCFFLILYDNYTLALDEVSTAVMNI